MNYIISEMLEFSRNCLFFLGIFSSKEIFLGKENREIFLPQKKISLEEKIPSWKFQKNKIIHNRRKCIEYASRR